MIGGGVIICHCEGVAVLAVVAAVVVVVVVAVVAIMVDVMVVHGNG